MKRYRIGLLAPEFPPTVGGMEQAASRLASSLAETDDVVVYTVAGDRVAGELYERRPLLTCHIEADAEQLAKERVDGWCSLNAGLIGLAPLLRRPFASYCHGNDFLDPWIVRNRFRLEPLKRLSRLAANSRVSRKVVRRDDIARGLPAVAHVFANSTLTARLFGECFPENPAPVSVVPPGIQSRFFQDHARTLDETLRILTVARLEPRKNVDGVLRALAMISRDVRWHYTVIGDGSMRRGLEQLSRNLGFAERVTFRGSVGENDLIASYGDSDLFILASKATETDVEGFGMVYVEACASGVPVICSREGGALDAVNDGVSGLIIPSSSPHDIAAGIMAFLQSRDRFPGSSVRAFAKRFEIGHVAAAFRTAFVAHL
jgi:glycosyltransferase involved in cell wall biosynthesis